MKQHLIFIYIVDKEVNISTDIYYLIVIVDYM